MTYDPIDANDDGIVESDVDNDSVNTDDLSTDQQADYIIKKAEGNIIVVGHDSILTVEDDTADGAVAAIDVVESTLSAGEHVHFMGGTYLNNQTESNAAFFNYKNTADITVTGEGRQTVLKQADNSTDSDEGCVLLWPGDGSEIAHLKLDGNRQNNTPISDTNDGANIQKTGSDCFVHHVWSENSTGDGVEIAGENCVVTNNILKKNWEQAVHTWSGNCEIAHNICRETQNDGSIRIFAGSGNPSIDDAHIHHNIITNPSTTGIYINTAGPTVNRPKIEHNTIIDAGGSSDGSADNSSNRGIELNHGQSPEIRGNTVINPQDNGITWDNTITNPTVEDNRVVDAVGGILGRSSDGVSEITDNTVESCSSHGIQINSFNATADNYVIKENVVTGCDKRGIHVRAQNDGFGDVEIADNTVKDNNQSGGGHAGIHINANDLTLTEILIEGNKIYSTGTPRHEYSIAVVAGTGSVDECRVLDNVHRGADIEALNLSGIGGIAAVHSNEPAIFLSYPPKNEEGNEYWDDGSNTGSTNPGKRVYLNGGWVDAYTA